MNSDMRLLTRNALAGDAAAIAELRRRGVLAAKAGAGLYPASAAQCSLWLWQQQNPGSTLYSLPSLLPLPAGLSSDHVEAAVNLLIARHEALRTVFEVQDGVPFQRVLPPRPLILERRQGEPASLADDLERPFDLEGGPPVRFVLLQGTAGQALYLNIHHLLFDGGSLDVLAADLAVLLGALTAGQPPELPGTPWQPKDFAAWQARMLDGPRGQTLREDWRTRLKDSLPLEFPTDFSRPSQPGHEGDTHLCSLSPQAAAATAALVRRIGCTALSVLAWAVGVLLTRHAGAGDLVLGLPCSGRIRAELQGSVGFLVNPLPLRLGLDPQSSVAASLAAAAAEVAWVLDRQDYPLERLIEDCPMARRPGRHPLFDVLVVMQPARTGGQSWDQRPRRGAKFDLSFHFEADGAGVHLALEYASSLFRPGRIERLAAQLDRLLVEAAADPQRRLADIDILPPEERHQVTAAFNATSRPYPADRSLASLFEQKADETPDAVALTWGDVDRPEAMTYSALDRIADAIAVALTAPGGARPGDVVGVADVPGQPITIAAMLAILKAGCAYMPLDPASPPVRLAKMSELAGCVRALAAGEAAKTLAAALPGLTLIDPGFPLSPSPRPSPTRGERDESGQAAAYVLFTSGSTGEPKAVAVPHRAVARLVIHADFHAFGPEDSLLQAAPLSFDASTLEIWGALLSGGRLHLAERDDLLSPGGLAHMIRARGVTLLWLTATLCHRLAEEAPQSFLPLKTLMTGGEVLAPRLMGRILETCPDLTLVNGYGPTENTTFTTTWRIGQNDVAGPIPIGRPIANSRVFVLDHGAHPAPIGVWGEIVAAGDGLALGYLGRPDLTEAAFVTLPSLPGERLYLTGDIGRWREDGVLEFLGRRDTQVKIRGHRVELGEVEAALLTLPGVTESVALALTEPGGEGQELVAVVRALSADAEGWRHALSARLPAAMMPGRFVTADRFPTNANGKVDRAQLASLAARTTEAGPVAPPASPLEAKVAAVFAEFLERSAVGRDESFFALGGHSLKAMRLLARLEKDTGRRVGLRDFMTSATVAGVARLLYQAGAGIWTDIPSAPDATDFPLTPAQARLWMLTRLAPDSPAYTVSGAMVLEGALDEPRLARALTAVIERHEVLRARFLAGPNGARQRFDGAPSDLAVIDADSLAWTFERIDADDRRPFALEAGPPLRASLYRLGEGRWVLHIALHHIVADGWSVPLLLADVATAYRGGTLPPLAPRYRDYVVWQQATVSGPQAAADLDFWRRRLANPPAPLDLPADRPRPNRKGFAGASHDLALDAATVDGLSRPGERLFPALAALFAVLLFRLSGQRDLVIGVPVAGRDHDSLGRQIGLFVNTLALRVTIDPNESFRALADRVAASWADALDHRACPFEAVVEAVNPPRDPSRNPIFDVMLVLQNQPAADWQLPGVTARRLTLPARVAKVDVALCLEDGADGVAGRIEYASDLFDSGRIARMASQIGRLASSVLADPETPLAMLSLLSDGEYRQVTADFNATDRDYPSDSTIADLFAAQAMADPTAVAVIAPDGARLDCGALRDRAESLAKRLRGDGLGPGDVVGLCMERSAAMMVALFAIVRAGAAYLPLQPDLPTARLEGMVADARPRIILASPQLRSLAEGLGAPCLIVEDAADTPSGADAGPAPAGPGPDDPAYVLFTSGSTGRPKGVVIGHRGLVNRLVWMGRAFPIGPGDVILHKTPLSFDVSVWELFWWSLSGAAQAVLAPGADKDPGAIVEAVAAHRATVMHFVPSMLRSFLDWLESGRSDPRRLASLRLVFASGEALGRETALRFARLLPWAALHNLYGPTEATIDVTWEPATAAALAGDDGPLPIGRPIDNCRLYIVDPQGHPVPIGVWGEIWLGGVQVADGYLNRPDLTEERFADDPFRSGGRIYRTGDRGRWRADGRVDYGGRLDAQLKIRGQRIEPAEIEAALERISGVDRAVVGAETVPDGAIRLVAHVAVAPGLTAMALRQALRRALPDAMVPERFYAMESLPLTSSGKLDRTALGTRPLDGGTTAAVIATEDEAAVMALWREVLPPGACGPDDSFFDVGGNSLRLIALHERLDRRWPGRLGIADLFVHHTVAAQAAALAGPAAKEKGFFHHHREEGRDEAIQKAPLSPGLLRSARSDDLFIQDGSASGQPGLDAAVRAKAVAVIGIGLRLADYRSAGALWDDLVLGVDRIGALPETRRQDARALLAACGLAGEPRFGEAAYLDDIASFDYRRFRLSPADAAMLDPDHRLFLETAAACLDDAGLGGDALKGGRVGVFVGASSSSLYRSALHQAFPERAEQIFALNVPSNLVTRISYLLDWRGPAALVDTACSSSLNAVHLASRALAAGECDLALVGGVKSSPAPHKPAARFAIESASGRTHAFDALSDGTGEGEGVIALLLKPLARAEADGDPIHAVILGSAVNQDGASAGMTAPNPEAQAEVILAAASDAGISLDSVGYIEAHGTGTPLGDPIEIRGIGMAFATHTDRRNFAGVGSVKGNFGHLDAAAGILGLVKAMLVLKHRTLVPQPFFTAANPAIDFDSAPVFVPRTLAPLVGDRAGVSAFGLSGVNAHVILEAVSAPPPPASAEEPSAWQMIPLSAASLPSLRGVAAALVESLAAHPDRRLAEIAHTLTVGRTHLAQRIALCADHRDALTRGLIQVAAGLPAPEPAGPEEIRARARRFLAGEPPLWNAETDGRPNRLHLPPTPFEALRCWPDFPRPVAILPAPRPTWLDPIFLDTAQGYLHRLPLADIWAASEHRLAGQPVLVGTALPRLCVEAARHHLPAAGSALVLSALAWHRPFAPDELAGGSALARVTRAGAGLVVGLEGRPLEGKPTCFAEARIDLGGSPPPPVDVVEQVRQCPRPLPIRQSPTGGGVISVGSRWDCIESLHASEDDRVRLALLSLPAAFADDLAAVGPHPAMLDRAVSLGLDDGGMVPVACAAIRLHADLPARVWARLTRRLSSDNRTVADILLFDESGRVLVAVEGMVFARLMPVALRFPAWSPLPPVAPAVDPPLVLLWAEPDEQGDLAALLGPHGRVVRSDLSPEQLAEQCRADAVARIIVALAPTEANALRFAWFLQALLAGGLFAPTRVLALGCGGYALGGDAAILAPDSALFAGLCLAVGREEGLLTCRYLDAAPGIPPETILAEIEAAEADPVVAWRDGRRFGRSLTEAPPAGVLPAVLPSEGCAVITGGLGGLGLTLAGALAARGDARIALLSRRDSLPGDDSTESSGRRTALEKLEHSGATLLRLACDVADPVGLTAALEIVRQRLGPITTVIHCAGVEGDGFLQSKDHDRFRQVLAPKVAGTRLLHAATLKDPVSLFLLAGSATGLSGAPGQSDYTAANAFLDAFAHWRRARGLPAICIDWPALADLGMAKRRSVALADDQGISSGAVPAVVEAALASGAAQVVPMLRGSRGASGVKREPGAASAAEKPVVHLTAPAGRAVTVTEATIGRIWAESLGYGTLAVDDDYYALGGDSIVGMTIVNRINQELGYQLSSATLLTTGTIAALARHLDGSPAASSPALPLRPATEHRDYPLSVTQDAVWRVIAAGDSGVVYNLPQFYRLAEKPDRRRLERAIGALIRCHAILRTRFVVVDGEPRMVVEPEAADFVLTVERLAADAVEDHAGRLITPFDLSVAPLLRACLLEVDDGRWALFLDTHHLVADAMTLEILAADLAALYDGTQGAAPSLALGDYTVWEKDFLAAGERDRVQAFWREHYRDGVPVVDLPADAPRPPCFSYRGDAVAVTVDDATLLGLRAQARALRVTVHVLVLASWALLLARLSGSTDLSVGVADNGRILPETEGMAGMFARLLPLRLSVRPDDDVKSLVLRVHEASQAAQAHRLLDSWLLLEDLGHATTRDRPSLTTLGLSYMNFAEGDYHQGELRLIPLGSGEKRSSSVDVTLFARETPDRLSLTVEYYVEIFSRRRIERMAGLLLGLLDEFARAEPSRPLAAIDLVSPEERRKLVDEFNPLGPPPVFSSLAEAFARRVADDPTATAVEDGPERFDYGELDRRSAQVARALLRAGASPGQAIGLCMERRAAAIVAMVGIIRAGAVYMPLDPVDPPERLDSLIRLADCRLAVTDRHGHAALAGLAHAPVLLDPAFPSGAPEDATSLPATMADDPAYLLFTSGSTGTPKAVLVPHRAVLRLVLPVSPHRIERTDAVLQAAPLGFDASTLEIWGTLLAGARLCLADVETILAPGGLARHIAAREISWLWLTASLCQRIAEATPEAFRPLRVLMSGGEPVSPTHMRRILKACPDLTLINGYGPTENTTFTTTWRIHLEDTAAAIPIGRPIPGTRVHILDGCDRLAPIGVWGEICCAGDGLALGYLGQPELTAAAFVSVPTLPGERLYRTGDLGRWREDGVIEFLGRRDDQIKIRGFRIEPAEIEAALTRSIGVVAAAMIVERTVEEARLVACLVTADGFDVGRTLAGLRRILPGHMIPGRFVRLAVLPLNGSGKCDRAKLAVLAGEAPELRAETLFEPPATPSERIIADAFAVVFRRTPISRHDDFHDLGGHSLVAARIVAEVATATGASLPLGEILRRASVKALGQLLETLPRNRQPMRPAEKAADYPTSHAQRRLFVLHRLPGADTAYNMPFVFEFGDGFDPDILVRALDGLAARHEALRTFFIERDGVSRQVIAERVAMAVERVDLSHHAHPRIEAFRRVRRALFTPFDLSAPPLLRVLCFDLGGGSVLVALVMHHIIGDGWSMRVLFRDLGRFYRMGPEASLPPPLTFQYKDYTVWQLAQAVSEHDTYWRAQLAGAPERIGLPFDRSAPSSRSFRGATIRRILGSAEAGALHRMARAMGATLANVMMALYASLLYRLARQDDIVLGLGIAGRAHPEIADVVGFFVNILPIRIRLSEEMAVSELVAQIRDTTLEAFDHQDYPFDLLVRAVAPRRRSAVQPLLNVTFEYQDFSSPGEGPGPGDVLVSRPFDEDEMRAIESGSAKFDLTLFVSPTPDEGLQLRLEYDTDLMDARTADSWLGYLIGFARAAGKDAER